MKSTKREAKRTTTKRAAGSRTKKSKDAAALRQEIENLVKQEAMQMVHTAILEADKGHFAAMKYLFEMVGLYPGPGETEPQEDDSLARTLLRRLGMPEEISPVATVATNANTTANDTVE